MNLVAGNALVPLLVALVVLALDVWVLSDARARADAGRDVVATLGPLTLASPAQWFIACVLLWVFFFPLYLVARRA